MTQKNLKRHTFYLSHGGGPLPLLGDSAHREMVAILQRFAVTVGKPDAILVISAHWEQVRPSLTYGAHPPLIYDYSGFPAESYQIQYPAPGQPELAEAAFKLLQQHDFEPELDSLRGFDHGLFVPLKLMYPEADIPCVQLSLLRGLNPLQHLQMGQALAKLPHDNLLIIGSGFSFHNMQAFFSPVTAETRQMNDAFEAWLIETCSDVDMDENTRFERLRNWDKAPFARYCHPREEHLLPLHVCYGVSQRACNDYAELDILGRKASMYLWSSNH